MNASGATFSFMKTALPAVNEASGCVSAELKAVQITVPKKT
jgi:hypothetical protein